MKLVLIIFLSALSIKPIAQTDSLGAYLALDRAVEFNGGDQAMKIYIANNLKYPTEAMMEGESGTVFLKLLIDTSGNVVRTDLVKTSGHKILNNSAKKFVLSMPKWNSAVYQGKKVSAYFRLPISYMISSSSISKKAETYYQKGVTFYEQNNQTEALNWFLKAADEDGEHIDALYNCAAIYFKQKNTEKACVYWNKIRNLGVNDAEIFIYKNCN